MIQNLFPSATGRLPAASKPLNRLAIFGVPVDSENGSTQAIAEIVSHLSSSRDFKLQLITVVKGSHWKTRLRNVRAVMLALVFSSTWLINGIAPCTTTMGWLRVFGFLAPLKRSFIYLHEGPGVLEMKFEEIPKLQRTLRRLRVIAVSRELERTYRNRFDLMTSGFIPEPVDPIGIPSPGIVSVNVESRIILVIGSLQVRKGIDFFSKLARHALETGQGNWRFVWAGRQSKVDGTDYEYPALPPNAIWLGSATKAQLENWIRRSFVVISLSKEDPDPLALKQSLWSGRAVVVPDNVAHNLHSVGGVRVIPSPLEPSAVLEVLDQMAAEFFSHHDNEIVNSAVTDLFPLDLIRLIYRKRESRAKD